MTGTKGHYNSRIANLTLTHNIHSNTIQLNQSLHVLKFKSLLFEVQKLFRSKHVNHSLKIAENSLKKIIIRVESATIIIKTTNLEKSRVSLSLFLPPYLEFSNSARQNKLD